MEGCDCFGSFDVLQRVKQTAMPKPDKVLRKRPLVEVKGAVEKLKKVVLFHPDPIVTEVPLKFCVCRKGEVKKGKRSGGMVQCGECLEWFHLHCVNIANASDVQDVDWKCEWCLDKVDKLGYQRWRTGRKTPRKRHLRDVPRAKGVQPGGNPPSAHTAPPTWEGKVAQVEEIARRAAIKKRKLKESAEKLVDGEGHHLVDAVGMAGLELRTVDEALVDEFIEAGVLDEGAVNDKD